MRGLAVSLGVRRPSQGHLEVGVERVRVLAVDSDLAEERELGLRVRGPQGAGPARPARVRPWCCPAMPQSFVMSTYARPALRKSRSNVRGSGAPPFNSASPTDTLSLASPLSGQPD